MFSIIILTHNKAPYTRKCLESILQTRGEAVEVIVVDNASTDETHAVLDEMETRMGAVGIRMRSIRNRVNGGCCAGRNQGMAAASGDIMVFMDNDVMASGPDWASGFRRCFEASPLTGIIGPKLIYPFPPHLIQCAGVAISRSGRVQFRGRGEARNASSFAVAKEVQCLISACFAFKREVYDRLGGLDLAFGPIEFEDFDFCYRARAAGYKCLYTPSVEMFHWESITSEGTERLPNTYLIIKHGMMFKQRWRHMFENEDGPPDSECAWRRIPVPSLEGERMR
ncbi:MAG TPA: glycosyltransferase family 2 protein [Candidatus Brocadiia bacterium]|nr:glycosyltransferase family 2 protein [Candidatus Brocadiia bacterium]